MKKILIAASAIALVASGLTVVPANATAVSASRATVGAECAVVGTVAKAKGADGSDLVCRIATIGTSKGVRQWLYAEDPILAALDTLITTGPGGFDTFGTEINRALKAEGLISAEPTKRNISGAGQTVGLTSFFNNDTGKANKAVVVGWASIGGVHVNKGTVKVSQLVPALRMTEDPIALVVRADSKYKTLKDLLADMKSKKIAIAGGSTGTQDQFMVASIYQKLGAPKNMNYIAYAGGGGALGGIMSDATFAAAVSGYDEFAAQIEAGKLRVVGISFSKRVPGIKAKTLSEQGMPVVVANWRGLALPASTTKENRDKFIRAVSVMRVSTTWKSVIASRNYIDAFMPGDRFNSWVKGQERAVSAAFTKLGL